MQREGWVRAFSPDPVFGIAQVEMGWGNMRKGSGMGQKEERLSRDTVQGIVVADRKNDGAAPGDGPRIAAFIWGGKVKPTPTLPYGRWKGAA